jgi:putative spermidine/putrescine transport system ATP-binding protein
MTAAETPPALSIRGVRKTYGQVVAVEKVDLDVRQGEFLTFLGPSGSGKSTLLYMIAGLEDVTEGEVLTRHVSLLAIPPHKRNIGMVFQRYTLVPHMNVARNIGFPLRVRHWTADRAEARVAEMLRLVRLEGFGERMPSQLSGGQQQRVALARALAYDPTLLLMDEPLAALDKRLKDDIQLEIRRIHRETGVTILYVTHDQEEALRLSDRIAVFNRGRIEQVGTGAELYERPASRFVAGFVGNSNFMTCTVTSRSSDRASVRLPDGTAVEDVEIHGSLARDDAASVLIRPEKLTIVAGEASQGGFSATVEDVTYLGEVAEVAARSAWGETLMARLPIGDPGVAELRPGSDCSLYWPRQHGLVFEPRQMADA